MTEIAGKTYWLVGASEGLGREIARQLSDAGAHLVLSARSADRLEELGESLPNARAIVMDATDEMSVKNASLCAGRIDGMIYTAGAYDPMPATNWNTDAAISMAQVNYIGALRVIGACLPQFIEDGAGDITLIGSLAGYRGLPKAVGYGASKAALISLAETMRHDLKGTGVTVRVVNPGFIETRLTQKNSFDMPQLMTPEKAATYVVRAMQSRRFRNDFPAPFSWVIRALRFVPDILFFRGK